jgi:hypothetical protein
MTENPGFGQDGRLNQQNRDAANGLLRAIIAHHD